MWAATISTRIQFLIILFIALVTGSGWVGAAGEDPGTSVEGRIGCHAEDEAGRSIAIPAVSFMVRDSVCHSNPSGASLE